MELKNAVAVCLIALFSSTLVVLVARSLDSQAASKLEPQLERIAEQLEAIRKAGGMASPGSAVDEASADDGLMVYYFYSNTRCPTCRTIESQAHEVVTQDFAAELASGKLTWKTLNYEQAANKTLAGKFEVQVPIVVLARLRNGEIQQWSRLDEVWGLVSDKPAFASFVRGEIAKMLAAEQATGESTPAAAPAAPPSVPLPEPSTESPAMSLPLPSVDTLPVPSFPADNPVRE